MLLFKTGNGKKVVFSSGGSGEVIFAEPAPVVPPAPPSSPDLLVYESDNATQFGDFTGDTTPTIDSMGTISNICEPVYLKDGASVTSITFNNCAGSGYNFNLNTADLDGSSLTTLIFSNVATLFNFTFGDSSNLGSVITLAFASAGYYYCYVTDTAGLTSLTTLSFSRSGYASGVIISDTSGFNNLTSCSFSYAGYFGYSGIAVNVIDTTNIMPEAAAKVLLDAIYAGNTSYAGATGTINIRADGDSTLSSVISDLQALGFTVTVTVV